MSTSLKRKFKSSIVYVKEKKIRKENVEDLVVSYVNTIIEMVESFFTEWCEKVNIFYDNVIIRLEKENTSVIKKFEKRLETNRAVW